LDTDAQLAVSQIFAISITFGSLGVAIVTRCATVRNNNTPTGHLAIERPGVRVEYYYQSGLREAGPILTCMCLNAAELVRVSLKS